MHFGIYILVLIFEQNYLLGSINMGLVYSVIYVGGCILLVIVYY